MARQHKIVVRGELSESAVMQALELAHRPILSVLRVPDLGTELAANVIVYRRASPFAGARVEVVGDMDRGTWELIA